MERPDKKTLTKTEFKSVYPEVFEWLCTLPSVQNPYGVVNARGHILKGKRFKCYDCGKDVFKYTGNLYKDTSFDGKMRCKSCSNIKANLHEGRKEAQKKGRETLKNSGWYESEEFHDSQVRAQATREAKGTNFMEYEIKDIIKLFPGGYHAPAGTVHSDLPGEEWIGMEMDVYWPTVRMCVELDTPDHQKKEDGYHKRKREYLQNHGITVLNIPVNRTNRANGVYDHERRVDGTMYDLIDVFLQGRLPRELEIMWDDPWYVNG